LILSSHYQLREHGRISGACFDAGRDIIPVVGEGDCGSLKEQRSITWKEGHEIRRGVQRSKQDQSG
ncbi:unnamed protein product, partial [Brassica oleracea var. botrytis]